MAKYYESVSRTFGEYLLIPGLTPAGLSPMNVDLRAAISRYHKDSPENALYINAPLVSSVMQAVSDDRLAVALATVGGLSFVYQSQSIESQAKMVASVKRYKAGFVQSDSNLRPDDTFATLLELTARTNHSTVAITDSGAPNGIFLGLVTSKDYRIGITDPNTQLKDIMVPAGNLVCARDDLSLEEANELIWSKKIDCLPILGQNGKLCNLVFRKDILGHLQNPMEAVDKHKRYLVGAGINTRDYKERVPALLEAGVDVVCIDSSDGFSEYQFNALRYLKEKFGDSIKVGGGNVVDKEGFDYLVEAGADFVKVGIGGGSICITREQKGIGRGQATSVIDVAQARDEHFQKTGVYVPICSDGGIVHDYHITLALAMGADFVMMGRYFARFDEAPSEKKIISGKIMKEYWAEGTNRAQNWERYDLGGDKKLAFEEGVEGFVSYAGPLRPNVESTLNKIKSTMVNCGASSLAELRKNAKLTLVSSTSIREGGYHDIFVNKDE